MTKQTSLTKQISLFVAEKQLWLVKEKQSTNRDRCMASQIYCISTTVPSVFHLRSPAASFILTTDRAITARPSRSPRKMQ